ncbi:lactate utilization protein [Geoalkalibacter sp.]|jgi:L-lactate dehydrogenase complex protein LldG|uniref:lactate utilization protein n=1 Tax=Geoalkalibacter sp. TaxID=3041440 RepID=UPI00272E2A4E|nr:lactate utilization protein [Geoalkalibacter sp.]
MADIALKDAFSQNAQRVGATVFHATSPGEAREYIQRHSRGRIAMAPSTSLHKMGLAADLRRAGCDLVTEDLRAHAPYAAAGLSGANFAIADTGTLVLESTAEATRLATTLPERHFALLDPRKIVADGLAAVPLVRRLQQQNPRSFLAYISGPSRTADIERVLTIGVHGPCELHILLLDGLSDDPLEN